ncbi:Endo-beta-mannanase [Actinomyces bovis]|uniref:Endo-beta-mannanase n=1 Tax=Actinomyces bovis TaxID=1658 RepID=A0ABY1VP16_9ACTO|nr:hypothetical protein [Actinomyces bovis]SPT53720.1 Endo-beta-mannanase [Actinomyces bovis]VEG55871.1 Endo-beta-mannanase [Actinomyces israelii]
MRFGVNYTPRVGWFHSWLDLDLGLVAEDMAAIADLGLDHVRIFPLWPLLQPNRALIRPRAVEDVLVVVDVAAAAGLRVTVDALQGHLSSFDFLPSWVTTWHQRNLFTDPEVLSGQRALVRTLAAELAQHPGAEGLSLGNEFIQFAAERHPCRSALSPTQARAWLETLLREARDAWPQGVLTHSYDDDLWFDDTHPFEPAHAVGLGDLTTVHSWVFMQVGPRYGAGHPALHLFARYLVELARAWGGAGRGIWLQEVGAPNNWVPPVEAPEFVQQTVASLVEAAQGPVPELEAITWWCSHDVDRELVDFPELEHTLGLFAADGSLKPTGEALREAVAGAAGPACGGGVERECLRLPSAQASKRSLTAPTGELFDQWLRRATAGEPPALALPALKSV